MREDFNQLRHDDPDAFGRHITETTLEGDRAMKVDITKNGPEDNPNRVLYLPIDSNELNVIVPASLGPPIPAPDVIAICGQMARENLGPPFLVAWAAEGYMQTYADENDPNIATERGQLTQRFKDGELSVFECLIVNTVHRRADNTFRVITVSQPYHYAEGSVVFGKEEWVDSLELDTYSRGPVIEQMIAIFGSEQN